MYRFISKNTGDLTTVVESLYLSPKVSIGEHCDKLGTGITIDSFNTLIVVVLLA